MKTIIESVTRGLSSSVAFYFGNPAENNLALVDEPSDIIAVLMPYNKEGVEDSPGTTTDTYHMTMLFLKRSDLDLDFGTRFSDYLSPMEGLADEFFLKLKNHMEKEVNPRPQKSMSNRKIYLDKFNIFDNNYDGVWLTFDVPKKLNISYCLNNYTETITSDGSAVVNDLVWLHNIDEISADGVTYGATASFTDNGYDFDITAGTLKTGSYTFTPTINADYTFEKRFWIKWHDGVTTVMKIKINYTYSV